MTAKDIHIMHGSVVPEHEDYLILNAAAVDYITSNAELIKANGLSQEIGEFNGIRCLKNKEFEEILKPFENQLSDQVKFSVILILLASPYIVGIALIIKWFIAGQISW